MGKRTLYIFLLLLCSFSARGLPDHILHKTSPERQRAIDSIINYIHSLDSAQGMDEVASYIQWAEDNDDKELALMFSFIPVKMHPVLLQDDDYENELLEKIKQAKKNGSKYGLIYAYHTLGIVFWDLKQYGKGIEYELKAYDLYKDMPLKVFSARVDYQTTLAVRYYAFEDYTRTKQLLTELKNAADKPLYEILGGGNYNTLALTYTKAGQYDSAIYAFNLLYNNEILNKGYLMAGIAAGNLGNIYYLQKDYDNAIKWLEEEYRLVNLYKQGHVNKNIVNSDILLAEMFIIKNMPGKATEAIERARAHMAIADKLPFSTYKHYYFTHAQLMAMQNHMHEAYRYLDSSRYYSDSAMAEFDKTKVMEAEAKIDRIKHDLELQELEHSRETSVFIRNAAILIISLLSVIALLLINRSRLRYKQHQDMLAKEKEKAEIELGNARLQLDKFTRNIQEKNKLIEQFTEEIDKLQAKEQSEEKNETLLRLQNSTILTDAEWDEFRILFETVHSGFLNRLKEKYAEISPAETRYLALTKLNLSNKEMANMLGTGTTAVRNYKYRLRKKLGLPDDDSFDEIIRNI